jgi:glycosyltransferase involved in cell wall biosynthesis
VNLPGKNKWKNYNNMQPLISIIIPVYNHAHTLKRSIESIFRQTYRPLEIIVVNDGSTDNFDEVVNDCFRLIEKECIGQGSMLSIISQENSGASAARNKGFNNSKGDYIIFWDADTIAEPAMLQNMFNALQQNPKASYSYSQFKFGWKIMRSQNFDAAKLKQINYIDTTSLIRRDAINCHPQCLEKNRFGSKTACIGPFDESLKRFQDWDLWLSFLEQEKTGIFVPEVLYRKIVAGRKGISGWLPGFMFKLPWQTEAVKKYEEAKNIIFKKHKLSI